MDHLRALRAFARIVELGSFTAAAEDLRLRQATVTRWIANLEDELGVRLLDRTTRSVRVTDAGQRFYIRTRQLLDGWQGAVAAAREERHELAGRVRASVPVVFGDRFVSPVAARWLEQNPAVELELLFSDRYVDLVAEGVDLALRVGRPVDSDYRARTLASTPRRLVAAPDYVARHGKPRNPAALGTHRCLLHSGLDNREAWSFEHRGETVRVDVRGRFAANHSNALLQLALAGHGIALLASWLVDDAIAAGQLVPLLPAHRAPAAPIQVLWASRRHRPRVVEAFVEHLATELIPLLAGQR